MRDEAIRALNEALVERNRGGRSFRIPGIDPPADKRRWETLADWRIDFSLNTDEDALSTPLIVHADFFSTHDEDDRLGDRTERISRRAADGTVTTTTGPAAASGQGTGRKTGGTVLARLEYEDDRGPGVFEMTTRQIKIGRGGRSTLLNASTVSAAAPIHWPGAPRCRRISVPLAASVTGALPPARLDSSSEAVIGSLAAFGSASPIRCRGPLVGVHSRGDITAMPKSLWTLGCRAPAQSRMF